MDFIKRLVRQLLPLSLVKRIEVSYRLLRGIFWMARYGFPARGARIIAVTGTNGKSTTSAYINEVLKAAGYKTAVLTTVFYEIAGKREPNETHFTISKQSIVQGFLARARKADVDWIILETTSHALDQDRIFGVPIKIAVITNLTQDHLDYHGSMENYADAKALLLTKFKPEHAILNADDEWCDYFKSKLHPETELFTIGTSGKVTGRLGKPKLSAKGGEASFTTKDKKIKIATNLVGEFNLQNAGLAAAVGCIFLLEKKIIEKGIANVKSLDGRMELVNPKGHFAVYVDFAITPDALDKALSSLQKITKGKVRVVFGATGDRDKEKRPIMGEVAAKKADFIYLTDDETYTEDPGVIRDAVFDGIKKAKGAKKTQLIPDRKKAIETAIKDAKKGDSILLAGIGHETERNMGGKLIPWNEKEIAKKTLNAIK